MANKLQKLLFNLSTMSPLALIFAIAYWIENDIEVLIMKSNKVHINYVSVILIAIISVSIIFSFYSSFFVKLCHKKLERMSIAVDNIVPHDSWVIVVLLSYALPAAGIVFKDINMYLSIIIILFWILFLALSNTIIPNPLLMIQGYHFYKISTVDGSSDICLLSTRKGIHNRKAISTVMIAFDYLAMEDKDNNV